MIIQLIIVIPVFMRISIIDVLNNTNKNAVKMFIIASVERKSIWFVSLIILFLWRKYIEGKPFIPRQCELLTVQINLTAVRYFLLIQS